MSPLALFLASLLGLSLGLLGGGGSTLAVPVLAYVVGLPAKEAIATSLIVVGATSLFGALRHFLRHNIDGHAALVFGVVSMISAFVGGKLARFIPDAVQLTVFALVMLAAAVSMLRKRPEREGESPRRSVAVLAIVALGVGFLTGVVGIGGGFLIVPSLVLFAHLDMRRAVGTSLVVIAMNSAAAFAGYAGHVSIAIRPTVIFTLFAFLGVAIGSALVHRVPTGSLRKGFAVFLIVVAVFVLYREIAGL